MQQSQLFVHQLRRYRIGDALAKDRHGEPVGLAGAELVVRSPEKRLMPAWRQQGVHGPPAQDEPEDFAVAATSLLEERNGIPAESDCMAKPRQAAGKGRHDGQASTGMPIRVAGRAIIRCATNQS